MLTGQISSHALQLVQDQTSSGWIRSKTLAELTVIPSTVLHRGRHCRVAGEGGDLAELDHDLAGVEWLAGELCWADRRAPPADGAGIGVEQLLPGELGDLGGANGLDVVGLHEVGDRSHRTLGALVWREEHVRR